MYVSKALSAVVFALSLLVAGLVHAEEDKSLGLFVNLSTFDTGPAAHAIQMAGKMMDRGHSVAFFLNQKAVLFADGNTPVGVVPMAGKSVREMLGDLLTKGATVIVCQVCAKMNGVNEADLVEGAQIGSPELVSSYLFDRDFRVISW